ncbi:type 1 glutamine amidotransferase domain-containing protein [Acinetobacter proteolyticus]|uniref:Type 1 glutamine amidotransferase domain-containing protein n=1 Tax=Acinetobacter proteolyticus TaxID=1776741 RepID=A0A2N0WF58_9GAMM|nr:type 1 glutamine amidotransferase domain-containing protein [Acinetobacter proteolyticus]MBK5649272.1 type 1 glutamine amidotransferase domain-containing protein [Acinetobacter sp.]PKF33511.1 type 1 glutamine amidotransferase domain-containing protein [Acinetobacter proteolyticus]
MSKRILHVVTNISKYEGIDRPTGLWLGELTHAYDEFDKQNYLQDIVSPNGGLSPIEPKSLERFVADASVLKRKNDPTFMQLLETTKKPSEINWQDYDAIYYTGGHGVMWDFLDNAELQDITKNIYEQGGVVASVCHGYCGLLNVRLSTGEYLIAGKKLTGFAWCEEVLAGVAKKVPYNAEELAKERGAHYQRKFIPFLPNVVRDANLITGQNPFSARVTAFAMIDALEAK